MKKFIPTPLLAAYHYSLAMLGSVIYGFPSKKLFVIAVTGTKGKSTVVELIRSMLARRATKLLRRALSALPIGNESERNLFKMTMPGRFFLAKVFATRGYRRLHACGY
jgi:hypothetical protein